MENLFVWQVNNVIEDEVIYDDLILPNTTVDIADLSLIHYYYWGVEDIGIYIEGPEAVINTLLFWGSNYSNTGLYIKLESGQYYFKYGELCRLVWWE